jgi:hypothetical protein
MTHAVQYISIAIDCDAERVYGYASNPANLPRWASGLRGSIEQIDGEWIADSPLGKITIQFAEANKFGVLDHDVTIADGTTFHNAMRVVPNGDGSELVFTLFRLPGVSDDDFAKDAATIESDLRQLKSILEK